MNELTTQQLKEIDVQILSGSILEAIRLIMNYSGADLKQAALLNRKRYSELRELRPNKFGCNDEAYWSGYSECPFDAITRDL